MATPAESPRFLFLIPSPPLPFTFSSLKATCGNDLSQVLREVTSHSSESPKAAILDIALCCPNLVEQARKTRADLYDATQAAVAAVYKLVCVIAAKDGLNIEDDDGVDVRVLPVAWSSDDNSDLAMVSDHIGLVVTLDTLAQSGRQWQYAFGVESEAGEAMMKAFVAAKGANQGIGHVEAKDATSSSTDEVSQPTELHSEAGKGHHARQRHYHIAVGGTFDHLHIGHKLLLTMSLFMVDNAPSGAKPPAERSVTIGITGDQLLKNKKHASVLESWEARQFAVQDFVDGILNYTNQPPTISRRNDPGPNGKSVDLHYANGLVIKCTEIQDPFGPTITEEHISALIISGETRAGGKAVNDKRKEKGWAELEVFEVDVLDAEDEGAEVKEGFANKLSSTAIREKIASKTAGL